MLARSVQAPFRPSRGIVVGAVVGFPASVALLLLSLRHLDTGALQASLRAADPWTLALAVCTISVVYPIQAARWRLISMASPPLPLRRFVDWVLGAIAINNVVPGRPGDLLRIQWLSRGARMPRTPALASVAVDRGLDVVALVVALALTYPVMQHALWLDRLEIVAGLVGLLVVMLLVAATVYARRSRVSPAGRVRRVFANAGREAGNRLHGWRGLGAVLLTVARLGRTGPSAPGSSRRRSGSRSLQARSSSSRPCSTSASQFHRRLGISAHTSGSASRRSACSGWTTPKPLRSPC